MIAPADLLVLVGIDRRDCSNTRAALMQDPRQRIAAAIDPEDLTASTWACEYLADAYDIALCIEADGESWADARTRF